ncbi:MAG TPA: ATP-binding protein [Anaerolineaceae bacterium]|nr:ATP-binding protein [Anaerolineaceae bacterium]HOH92533.1 ATP-binding protein [Anaerolineaceae bacterium]HPX65804.1 ATP-binding protein [Anaerolineaceae bacterium]HQN68901.1 ATP-binding protein [Anaerolineaceae bacterium]
MKIATFPANYASVRIICNIVTEHAKTINFSSRELYGIELATDEACANIIDHAYCGENMGSIHLFIETTDKEIKIVLEDAGKPFEPAEVLPPDLESPLEIRAERGLGVFLIKTLMDEVTFENPEPGLNRLTMIKHAKELATR